MAHDSEKNKTIVREFYEMAFNAKKPKEAVAKYVGARYRQYNPTVGDGPDEFVGFVNGFAEAYPELHVAIKRLVAEDDIVVAHSHIVPDPNERGTAAMDMFRIEDGKIVEHWDVLQEVPERSANANGMF